MTPVLMFLGLLASIWAWQNLHPLAGLLVGFLLVGGLGWQLLMVAIVWTFSPDKRRYGFQFLDAWEALAGPGTDPPHGAFTAWVGEHKRTGVSATDWLREQMHASG